MAAAGVDNTDINTREAWYSKGDGASQDASWTGAPIHLPRIQGADVCGRVVAVGGEVSADRIGERVLIGPCLPEANGRSWIVPGTPARSATADLPSMPWSLRGTPTGSRAS
jgi:NADPH:quinone reductase-like Zn-dependent oxidoreductase